MKKFKPLIIILVILSITLIPKAVSAKSYKTYTSQLTKSEKKIKTKLIKQLKKYPQKKTFVLKKKYKSSTMSSVNKKAIKRLKLLQRAVVATSLDYPEFYWISGQTAYSYRYSNKRYIITFTFNNSVPHSKKNVKTFKNSVKKALTQIRKENPKSKKEKVIAINKWMCERIKYRLRDFKSYTAYGAVVQKEAVCDGFSSLFKIFCKKLSIPCFKIRGKGYLRSGARENHAWNLVYVNSKWLGVDTTWNNTTKKQDYALLVPRSKFTDNHKKMKENGKIEGFYLNGKLFTFKLLKAPF